MYIKNLLPLVCFPWGLEGGRLIRLSLGTRIERQAAQTEA
jgi:hypothetical protein